MTARDANRHNDDRHDPLDPLLEELLGGVTPPDLSQQILARLAQRQAATDGAAMPAEINAPVPSRPVLRPIPLPTAAATPTNGAAPGAARNGRHTPGMYPAAGRGKARNRNIAWGAAAVALLLAAGLWLATRHDQPVQVANAPANKASVDVTPPAATPAEPMAESNVPEVRDLAAAGQDAEPARVEPSQATPSQPMPPQVAASTSEPRPESSPAAPAVSSMSQPSSSSAAAQGEPQSAPDQRERVAASTPAHASSGSQNNQPQVASDTRDVVSTSPSESVAASRPNSAQARAGQPGQLVLSSDDGAVVGMINHFIRVRWEEAGVTPASQAADTEWCRRVYLDVIGRIPTIYEIRQFLSDRSPQRRVNLVNRLLDSDEYAEEYARNWSNVWENLLIGRSNDNELINRDGLRQYLRRTFVTNKPFDQFAIELLTATGSNRPGDPDFNGAVNFLLDNLQEKATPATAKVSRLFLGVQVQCTQCHNHPFYEAKQNQFWELNAFFRQAKAVSTREAGELVTRLVDEDFAGEGNTPDEAEIYYELRNGLMITAYPVFLTGEQIRPSGRVSEVNRRRELAALVTSSDLFRRAIVNRVWAHFLGYGFTRPVDEMGPHNAASHPELLEQLASAFAQSGFDHKRLVRWIVLSEPYNLSSRAPKNTIDQPEIGNVPLFSRFYVRQMRPEELYESLLVATHSAPDAATYSPGEQSLAELEREKNRWLQQFTIAFDTDENDEATTFDGTITQTLAMWNGELVRKATSAQQGTFLHEVAQHAKRADATGQKVLQDLFLAALGRNPKTAELTQAQELLRRRGGDVTAALQDIWWALLNSNEFILNH